MAISSNQIRETQTPEQQRRDAMAVLAGASARDIARGLNRVARDVAATELRPAETGLVMLRGRIGGNGAPFNIGEATVTRAAVQLATGERGFSYALGRDREKARLAAICDALWQCPSRRKSVEDHIIAPLRQTQDARRDKARAETAATRVDFFTLVRGEDE
jgi:alpha-D-ribose 1-methylphosphonate 5-triphosphate synthase subunit PhnG